MLKVEDSTELKSYLFDINKKGLALARPFKLLTNRVLLERQPGRYNIQSYGCLRIPTDKNYLSVLQKLKERPLKLNTA